MPPPPRPTPPRETQLRKAKRVRIPSAPERLPPPPLQTKQFIGRLIRQVNLSIQSDRNSGETDLIAGVAQFIYDCGVSEEDEHLLAVIAAMLLDGSTEADVRAQLGA